MYLHTLSPKVERNGDVTIVTFSRCNFQHSGNLIAEELEGRLGALGDRHLLLDLSNVEFLSSDELGTLIGLHKRMVAVGGRLTLFNLSADLYEVFSVTRLRTFLRICREEAQFAPC